MALKFQYNKTSLNELGKNLKARERTLPTIKNKESALRTEVRKAKMEASRLEEELKNSLQRMEGLSLLFPEVDPSALKVTDVELKTEKIAGVTVPALKKVHYQEKSFDFFGSPAWLAPGMELLKYLAAIGIESEVYLYKMQILEKARKKTTQKVNLYEKVQIPGYKEAILKIKRFIEDEENLSKSSQKIVKNRHLQEEEGL